MERGQLIAVLLPSDHPRNLSWARARCLARRPRWTVMAYRIDGSGCAHYGAHPVLSKRMFKSYSDAVAAIDLIEQDAEWNR